MQLQLCYPAVRAAGYSLGHFLLEILRSNFRADDYR
jgi:hypothetical protein